MTYAFVILSLVGLVVFVFMQGTPVPQNLQASVDTLGIRERLSSHVYAVKEHLRDWVRDIARDELHQTIDKAFEDEQ
jgi:hypothetical protein